MTYQKIKPVIDQVNGFMGSEAQREFMFNLGKVTTCAAEIGSYKGLSACIVAAGINSVHHLTANKPRYFCIDTFACSNAELDKESTLEEFTHVTSQIDTIKCIQVLKGWSTDWQVLGKVPSLEWVYVDGSHETQDVIADIKSYHPKVQDNGMLLFHDHTWDSVRAAIDWAEKVGMIKQICHFDDFGVYKKI